MCGLVVGIMNGEHSMDLLPTDPGVFFFLPSSIASSTLWRFLIIIGDTLAFPINPIAEVGTRTLLSFFFFFSIFPHFLESSIHPYISLSLSAQDYKVHSARYYLLDRHPVIQLSPDISLFFFSFLSSFFPFQSSPSANCIRTNMTYTQYIHTYTFVHILFYTCTVVTNFHDPLTHLSPPYLCIQLSVDASSG